MSAELLDERAQNFLEALTALGVAPLEQLTVAEARDRKLPELGLSEKIETRFDIQIPVRHGSIRGRVYVPEVPSDQSSQETCLTFPTLVYIHGGGWVLGELDDYNQLCSAITNRSRAVTVSLEYRLAPETPFPGPVEDCIDAVAYLSQFEMNGVGQSGRTWKTDPQKIIMIGDSAGGNLSAAVVQEYLDNPDVNILGQVLIYPVTDSRFDRPSYQEFNEGFLLTTAAMKWFWNHYCPDESQRQRPEASPINFLNPEKLPPTYLMTCGCDPLRDEGNEYGEILKAAGVDIYHEEIPGMIHAFIRFIHSFPQSSIQISQIANWVQTQFKISPNAEISSR